MHKFSAMDWGVDNSQVSSNAYTVVQTLQQAGYEAYLVGGCVRDLLLQRQPKDFDVATSASPEKTKQLFKTARIIGRRFKIVHVNFGWKRNRETIEVATFRASPDFSNQGRLDKKGFFKKTFDKMRSKRKVHASGRILDDNVYGDIEQDVLRRDFTVNALYYDPVKEQIIDFVGAFDDILSRTLNIIGDMDVRFEEDPVRMLRVLRFKVKLNLYVPEEVTRGINKHALKLADIPPARLFDEMLKLFKYGDAENSWVELVQTPLMTYLLPLTLASISSDNSGKSEQFIRIALRNTDKRVNMQQPVAPAFLFAVFLWPVLIKYKAQHLSRGANFKDAFWAASEQVFREQSDCTMIAWRVRTPINEIWQLQFSLERRQPGVVLKILESRRFRAAYDFLLMRQQVHEVDQTLTEWWTRIQKLPINGRMQMIDVLRGHAEKPSGNRVSKSRKKIRTKFGKQASK